MTTPSASVTSSAAAATSSLAGPTLTVGKNLKIVGIILAITSGLLIGASFVFKKKGLLRAQAGHEAGEGVRYLKSPLWWIGMTMMILGELCNFAAYAFVEAIVVTPLGALSVVICAILSSIFLKEKLSFFGWLGCGLCIIGSVIIALNGPQEASVGQIREFQKLFAAPGFIAYISVLIVSSLVIIFYFAPKYGKKSMLWYIMVCSMIGGISVSVTTGLGSAIVQTAMGDNQFKFWFMYFLIAFVVITLITEVYYLNVALALFNTAMVTPTYYVIFTFFSMVTTIVLFKGLDASASQIITIVMAFLVICVGITILQMSKVDPVSLSKLDRRSTILLQAARSKTESMEEKGGTGIEDPGMDALRGSFGTVGSIIRARSARRMSQSSRTNSHTRPPGSGLAHAPSWVPPTSPIDEFTSHMKRHQLYDAPVPRHDDGSASKRPTIKFDSQDVVHQYNPPGTGDDRATHSHRQAVGVGSPALTPNMDGFPLTPMGTLDDTTPSFKSDLVEVDDASIPQSSPSSSSQTLTLPPTRSTDDYAVRSAPPAINTRFLRPDTSDVFENLPSTGTLMSFSSVTDSASSGGWDDDRDRESRDTTSRDSAMRGKKAKRYPSGSGDDDREESISLWHRRESADYDDEPPQAVPGGGIRLVQPSKVGNKF